MDEFETSDVKSTSEILIENAKNAEIMGDVKGPMMPDGKKPAKKGRPKKEGGEKKPPKSEKIEKEPEAPKFQFNIPNDVLMLPVLKGVSVAAVNIMKDNRAALTPDEAEQMAKAFGLLMDKYLPDVINKWGPEFMAFAACSQYGIRLYALGRVKKEEEAMMRKAEAARAQAQSTARPEGPSPQEYFEGPVVPVI